MTSLQQETSKMVGEKMWSKKGILVSDCCKVSREKYVTAFPSVCRINLRKKSATLVDLA